MTEHPISRYPAVLRPHLWAPEQQQRNTPNPQPPETGPLAVLPSWRLGTPRGLALDVDLLLALVTGVSGGGGVFLLVTNGFLIR